MPIIGITCDVEERNGVLKAVVSLAYARAVASAGGTPVFLPPEIAQIPAQLKTVDALVLTGGGDPRMEAFGTPTHPAAKAMHEKRQSYEMALLDAINARGSQHGSSHAQHRDLPVLGICLGMQMMALAAGGTLDQHLPDTLGDRAEPHRGGGHPLRVTSAAAAALGIPGSGTIEAMVASHHHQGVRSPGRLRVVVTHDDGTIEAISDEGRAFYVGVQWHPERTGDPRLGQALFDALVQRCEEQR